MVYEDTMDIYEYLWSCSFTGYCWILDNVS